MDGFDAGLALETLDINVVREVDVGEVDGESGVLIVHLIRKVIGPRERDDGLYVERLRRALQANTGELTDMESTILARRFPQNDQPRSTLQQIGLAVGLSKERVRQLQNSALQKLREVLAADGLLQ